MTDRELLELAAKAAGHEMICHSYDGWICINGQEHEWSPLHDDADALRLAVTLKLLVDVNESSTDAADGDVRHDVFEVPHGDDPYAATRRAITRAAAEIGKEM